MNECAPELSVVMPCLNEADTLETCITKARTAMRESGIDGEIIVADNGSTDGSQQIAERLGARVVSVTEKGYGSALMGGIEAAHGRFVIMGDADDSYDLLEIPKFVEKLRSGYDLVQGCRMPRGGGRIEPGAMPFLHRWWGNPMFTLLVRAFFHVPLNDAYCGMRGFTKDWYARLGQRCTGMEFAIENIIKSTLFGARIAEVPITLHPDGRTAHAPHLKTFRDGWRTLRFILLYSPRWLFFYPGALLILLGLFGYSLALPGAKLFGATLDAHTLLCASLAILLGYQAVLFALMGKVFGIGEGFMPPDPRLTAFFRHATLEKGLIASGAAFALGVVLILLAVWRWAAVDFGDLDYAHTMRLVVPGVTLCALGFQNALGAFFVSILGMDRKVSPRPTGRARS